jgi:hypothetical protein
VFPRVRSGTHGRVDQKYTNLLSEEIIALKDNMRMVSTLTEQTDRECPLYGDKCNPFATLDTCEYYGRTLIGKKWVESGCIL